MGVKPFTVTKEPDINPLAKKIIKAQTPCTTELLALMTCMKVRNHQKPSDMYNRCIYIAQAGAFAQIVKSYTFQILRSVHTMPGHTPVPHASWVPAAIHVTL